MIISTVVVQGMASPGMVGYECLAWWGMSMRTYPQLPPAPACADGWGAIRLICCGVWGLGLGFAVGFAMGMGFAVGFA